MIQNLLENEITLYVMAGVCLLGVLTRMITNGVYLRLIKASDSMSTSNNRLVKLLKSKFETCYELKIGVHNVDNFVDKYIYKYRFCGILLYTWENLCAQILMLCMFFGLVATGAAIFYECEQTVITSIFVMGLWTSLLLLFVDSSMNFKQKRLRYETNLKEYLENVYKIKMEQQYFTPEELAAYYRSYFTDTEQEKKEKEKITETKKEIQSSLEGVKISELEIGQRRAEKVVKEKMPEQRKPERKSIDERIAEQKRTERRPIDERLAEKNLLDRRIIDEAIPDQRMTIQKAVEETAVTRKMADSDINSQRTRAGKTVEQKDMDKLVQELIQAAVALEHSKQDRNYKTEDTIERTQQKEIPAADSKIIEDILKEYII